MQVTNGGVNIYGRFEGLIVECGKLSSRQKMRTLIRMHGIR